MKKHIKRFLSVLLVSLLLSQEVLAGVSVPAVPSSSSAPSALPATASDAADGEPFYYDEDGKKVYDSEIDWSQYRVGQDDYSDIMWTFEEYPETMMRNGDVSTYIVGVDDAVVIGIVAAACAACGYYISKSDIPAFISKGFEPWLRRNKGMNLDVMSMWQSALSVSFSNVFSCMKLLVQMIKEYLDSLSKDSGTITVPIRFSTWQVESPLPDWDKNFASDYLVVWNTYSSHDTYIEYDCYSALRHDLECLYAGYSLGNVDLENNVLFRIYFSSPRSGMLSLFKFCNDLMNDGYWRLSESKKVSASSSYFPLEFVCSLGIPIFVNRAAYDSWVNFGTTGGLLNGDADDSLTINTANQWTDLQQDFFNKYAFSDTFAIPATREEFDRLVDSLSQAQTGAEVITNLNTVWTITENGSGSVVSPTVAYSSFSYVLDAVAAYAGASALTAELRNGFLADYFHATLAGLTIDQLNNYAQTLVQGNISIKGTDEDNDSNTFVVTAALVTSFLSYLHSAGIIDSVPEVQAGTQLKANVKVQTKTDSGTTTPGGGTVDLSGITGLITSILSTLGGLPGKIAAEAITALTSSAFASGITLNLDTIRSALGSIAQWDFADWTSALGASVLLALKNFAIDLHLDGLADAVGSIAQWDFADWGSVFEGAINSALMVLGIDKLAGLADVLKGWDFADWSSVFRSVLDTALASSGLAGIAGILSGIKDMLKDLGLKVDLSPLTDVLAALSGLKDAVIAIPGQITDFFTIDDVVISEALAGVESVFFERFGGISQLSRVFTKSYSFGMEVPVFTVKVPAVLKPMFNNQDEIVMMDLRPHTDIFLTMRTLLVAMMWVAFAKWLLDQFNVSFHVG